MLLLFLLLLAVKVVASSAVSVSAFGCGCCGCCSMKIPKPYKSNSESQCDGLRGCQEEAFLVTLRGTH